MAEIPLYWNNPDIYEIECEILTAEVITPESPVAKQLWRLSLSGSPFYPGGGGQPEDQGTVAGCKVEGLSKSETGNMHEIASSGTFLPGDRVRCRVNKSFRRDSRQQHSGQHLISAALAQEGLDTVSVHLGSEYCGIEVEATEVSAGTIDKVLEHCDRWISEDRNINSLVLDLAEAASLPLRRPLSEDASETGKPVRIVEIEGIDTTGCGGVHLRSTAAVVGILFDGMEKIRGRIRLKWIIGDRLVQLARSQSDTARRLRQLLSAETDEIPERIESILADLRRTNSSLEDAEKRLGILLCEQAAQESDIAALVLGGASTRIQGALSAAESSNLKAGLFLGDAAPDGNRPWGIYLSGEQEDLYNRIRNEVISPAGGRGGGRPPLWRGSISSDGNELCSQFFSIVRTA